MNAYNETYLDDAMCNLGEMLDYAVNVCGQDIDIFFRYFISSGVATQFGKGNPKYVAGMSGVELAWDVMRKVMGDCEYKEPSDSVERSKEYWTGWVLAYYQWFRNFGFSELYDRGLTPSRVSCDYILHEADVSKFVDTADVIIEYQQSNPGERLKRMRAYWNYTQKELSEKSGVSLRMIQLYEQGQNDLSKAQAGVVLALSQALDCKVEDLL
ncbi:MAG: helix-turn-helix transcriptional regulator [Lachnospiraceae bacterium]|nr:helix-turn-helix transcriptional regulator [Lachnospiraceae bacterium]